MNVVASTVISCALLLLAAAAPEHTFGNKHARIINAPQQQVDGTSTAEKPYNVIELEVPVAASENKVLLQLPQQLQQQPQQLQTYTSYPYPYYTPPRKHYKITIVRQPARHTTPAPPPEPEIEEKTLIYVLVKKPDTIVKPEPEQQAQQEQKLKLNKPEVYFINYSEKQEASATQHSHGKH